MGLFSTRRHLRHAGSGSTAVETAIVLPVLLLFIFGIAETSRLVWIQHAMQYACQETGRYAMTNISATDGTLTAYAQSQTSGLLPAIAFTATHTTSSGINYVTIAASYTYSSLVSMINLGLPIGGLIMTTQSKVPLNS